MMSLKEKAEGIKLQRSTSCSQHDLGRAVTPVNVLLCDHQII